MEKWTGISKGERSLKQLLSLPVLVWEHASTQWSAVYWTGLMRAHWHTHWQKSFFVQKRHRWNKYICTVVLYLLKTDWLIYIWMWSCIIFHKRNHRCFVQHTALVCLQVRRYVGPSKLVGKTNKMFSDIPHQAFWFSTPSIFRKCACNFQCSGIKINLS